MHKALFHNSAERCEITGFESSASSPGDPSPGLQYDTRLSRFIEHRAHLCSLIPIECYAAGGSKSNLH